ncbi:DUF1127 domain-containing protein [Pseudomonas gingeri NCPPB 3146 = LMG 5327]|uniref:DUF1127 domain-containing protein n=2 Tax=Pseudomonas gingeri TaxID=117681 RepID=A0A7Y7XYN7_9PSED|nr:MULTISPECIES: DUF1127 domain-containing protein [Pseudomonas]NVZ28912.1 DUF1127 domain-containing protein [Pseudomonas gingeri]NWA07287.1 DUF1127 domain-containing protein [Pseudomonas gingeri]NWC14331.1 DUF1127 domain-containing protein [Pseudomonas gingeri]NWE47083.1 DUF1127 domain-containing protein [Pseudomonas gingeri]NWE67449.1 DUF1127 domain-containing protein [Pseudomonas gingeri]
MNGLSDVRLVLRSQELMIEQEHAGAVSVRQCAPALGRMELLWHRLRTRKVLLELTPDELRDIGLSREQARAEGLKPFWRS